MTGFARLEGGVPGARLAWEIRAVNHRYLDLQFKLPEELRGLEPELRTQAAQAAARGKIECQLRLTRDEAGQSPLRIDAARLAQLRTALDLVQKNLTLSAPDPLRVLAFPGVVAQAVEDSQPLQDAAREAFSRLLRQFNETRDREGARITEHIGERAGALTALAARVRDRYPQVRDQWIEKLRQRCADLGVEAEPQRLAQEIALLSQRLDVDEELSRLASHLIEVRAALAGREPAGRRLDFLMQELNRETNTIASKSQDAEMTKWAVEMKVVIEQMREQVQNAE